MKRRGGHRRAREIVVAHLGHDEDEGVLVGEERRGEGRRRRGLHDRASGEVGQRAWRRHCLVVDGVVVLLGLLGGVGHTLERVAVARLHAQRARHGARSAGREARGGPAGSGRPGALGTALMRRLDGRAGR